MNSLATDTAGPPAAAHVTDTLDAKIEALLRDWHHNPDLLFAIHPVDGSFLIWSVLSIAPVHTECLLMAKQMSFSTLCDNVKN